MSRPIPYDVGTEVLVDSPGLSGRGWCERIIKSVSWRALPKFEGDEMVEHGTFNYVVEDSRGLNSCVNVPHSATKMKETPVSGLLRRIQVMKWETLWAYVQHDQRQCDTCRHFKRHCFPSGSCKIWEDGSHDERHSCAYHEETMKEES